MSAGPNSTENDVQVEETSDTPAEAAAGGAGTSLVDVDVDGSEEASSPALVTAPADREPSQITPLEDLLAEEDESDGEAHGPPAIPAAAAEASAEGEELAAADGEADEELAAADAGEELAAADDYPVDDPAREELADRIAARALPDDLPAARREAVPEAVEAEKSDEDILSQLVLPASRRLEAQLGAISNDDRTFISAPPVETTPTPVVSMEEITKRTMPPADVVASTALPGGGGRPPSRHTLSTLATAERPAANALGAAATAVRKVATRQVRISVAHLALVVIAAGALGGALLRTTETTEAIAPVAVQPAVEAPEPAAPAKPPIGEATTPTAPEPEPAAQAAAPEPAPKPAAVAPVIEPLPSEPPAPAEPAPAVIAEEPPPVEKAAADPAPAPPMVASAAVSSTPKARRPGRTKPRMKKVAQAWVDPFQ